MSYDKWNLAFLLLLYWIYLTQWEKPIRWSPKPCILSFSPTYLINSVIHEHSCKILYIMLLHINRFWDPLKARKSTIIWIYQTQSKEITHHMNIPKQEVNHHMNIPDSKQGSHPSYEYTRLKARKSPIIWIYQTQSKEITHHMNIPDSKQGNHPSYEYTRLKARKSPIIWIYQTQSKEITHHLNIPVSKQGSHQTWFYWVNSK